MTETAALAEFKQGFELLRNGYPDKALLHLHRAAELEKNNPYYLSFLGLSVARAHRKWAAALELCEAALRLKRNEAQLYLNLAEVYVAAGRRDDAIETLESALEYFERDVRLRRARSRLGRRRSPVLFFLDRQNFLNRNLGKLRHRTLKYLQKSEVRR